jgi:CDP-diacylglycerol--glycerol-3-phosphate 3-phosphatidyltransferase
MPNRESGNREGESPLLDITNSLSRHQFWTVPNIISIGRILLLIPLFIFLRKGPEENGNFWALVVMGAALFTDVLDGLIARWFHVESDWGRVLDPLADKTWLGCLGLFLALPWRQHPLSWEFLVLVLSRDLAILLGSYWAYRVTGVVLRANMLGKLAMGFTAATLISHTVYWTPEFAPWAHPQNLMYAASAMLILSGLNYSFRLRKLLLDYKSSVS